MPQVKSYYFVVGLYPDKFFELSANQLLVMSFHTHGLLLKEHVDLMPMPVYKPHPFPVSKQQMVL